MPHEVNVASAEVAGLLSEVGGAFSRQAALERRIHSVKAASVQMEEPVVSLLLQISLRPIGVLAEHPAQAENHVDLCVVESFGVN